VSSAGIRKAVTLSELTTGRLLALVAILLAATFGVTFLIGRATRSSKPTETEVAPLQVSTAVLAVPTVRSVATLPPLKRPPKKSSTTTGSVTPPSTTGSVSPGSTTGATTGTPSGGTGGGTSGNTTGGGGGGTTTE
jgi:hypothetical protein